MRNTFLTLLSFFSISTIFSQELIYNKESETNASDVVNESKDLYTLSPTSINSKFSDIGATFFMDKFIMYSSRKTGSLTAGKDALNNTPYQSLYCLDMDKNGNLSRPNFFAYALNGKGNEAGIAFSPNAKIAYITKSDENNTNNYQLYKFDFDGINSWINEVAVDFNSTSYSIENPFVTSDGTKMYFASNMPGGYGGFDIYVADINEKGLPINPKNLGSNFNTAKDEKFPYVTPTQKQIYFSSNGHVGYGNYDVFVSNIKSTRFTTPINLGKTINTLQDEVAFILASENKGYVSSNKMSDTSFDIYKFELQKTPNILQGIVYNKESKMPLHNASVKLLDEDNREVATLTSDANGKFQFDVEPTDRYTITANKEGFVDYELPITTSIGNSISNIELTSKKTETTNKTIALETIYFDFNKYKIKSESTISLDKIAAFLAENSEMKITINAHTDSKGTEMVNLTLSNKRANAVKNYLLSKGIESTRIETTGYGETKPLSNCGDSCTESQYARDRRIDFLMK